MSPNAGEWLTGAVAIWAIAYTARHREDRLFQIGNESISFATQQRNDLVGRPTHCPTLPDPYQRQPLSVLLTFPLRFHATR